MSESQSRCCPLTCLAGSGVASWRNADRETGGEIRRGFENGCLCGPSVLSSIDIIPFNNPTNTVVYCALSKYGSLFL